MNPIPNLKELNQLLLTPTGQRVLAFASGYYLQKSVEEIRKNDVEMYATVDKFCRSKKAKDTFRSRSSGSGLRDFLVGWIKLRGLYDAGTKSLKANHSSKEKITGTETVGKYRCILSDSDVDDWFMGLNPRTRGLFIEEIYHRHGEE